MAIGLAMVLGACSANEHAVEGGVVHELVGTRWALVELFGAAASVSATAIPANSIRDLSPDTAAVERCVRAAGSHTVRLRHASTVSAAVSRIFADSSRP